MRQLAVTAVFLIGCAAAGADAPGTDFSTQVRAMFRAAACGNDEAIPQRLPRETIVRHCRAMTDVYGSYRRAWVEPAVRFIAALRPADLPKRVVYPFGGGDLSSALVVFPDATELTTISLEAAGDVRAIDNIARDRIEADLETIGTDIRRLYRAAHSTTKSLQAAAHSELPGTLMFALAGLAVHGMVPVRLRYFDFELDGTIRYLDGDELDARATELAKPKGPARPIVPPHFWREQTSAFANVEIEFRPRDDPKAPIRVYRHILANLDDAHLTKDDRVLLHLRGKGKVSVMTKAASFLLWWDDFSKIRDYLLSHAAWMISDSSGVPPIHAERAGFEQITYGKFAGPYFIQDPKNTRGAMIELWQAQPERALPFRFGYPDQDDNNHLLIMRPKSR